MKKEDNKVLANNKRARHDYFIEKIWEAGIALKGTEVKSVRQGKVSIQQSYVDIQGGEAWIKGLHISPYEQGNRYNMDPVRDRRLLLHKKEIQQLAEAIQRDGYTIIPLSVVLRGRRIKVDIALARGKKLYDKRQSLREAEDKRRIERTLKEWK
ncbi:SsrA-binding protein SmpB [Murdochiella massiliensis]|uniref:SsrA-binding protein SmpB n=1 Tax=Murdochiella massiliensis TaxID=1673723 RepID=UPI00083668A2|nr:SsrA-binding protein SmpB [Murdochiella massiliensis]